MKIILLIMSILLMTVSLQSQIVAPQTETIGILQAYTPSTVDTSRAFYLGAAARVGLLYRTYDSTAVNIVAEYKVRGTSTWTLIDSTATRSAVNTGVEAEWILRDRGTEKIPGLVDSVRFLFKWEDSCGTSTALYTSYIYRAWANDNLSIALVSNSSYTNSHIDTTLPVAVGAYRRVAGYFTTTDSAVAKIYVDTRTPNGSWAVKDSVSISSNVNAGTHNEWLLRDNTTDKIPGVATENRFRVAWSTNNGTSAPYYWFILYVNP